MDALSELIRVARLRASLDLRCQFAEGAAVDHAQAPAREIAFHLVLFGSCVLERQGAPPIVMHPGDFVALPGGAPHRVRTLSEPEPGHRLALDASAGIPLRRSDCGAVKLDLLCGRLAYQSSAIDSLFSSLPDVLSVSLGDARARVDLHHLVSQIRAEVDADRPGAVAIVAALSSVLFALALRVDSERDTTAPGMLRLIGDRRLARAARAILQDPGRGWTLERLADKATMSRATFARQFRDVASMTPGDFLLQVRMSRAAELLESTRGTTGDIGAAVGYQSEAAFAKAFKRVMGTPPASFRRHRHAASRPRRRHGEVSLLADAAQRPDAQSDA